MSDKYENMVNEALGNLDKNLGIISMRLRDAAALLEIADAFGDFYKQGSSDNALVMTFRQRELLKKIHEITTSCLSEDNGDD